MNRTAQSIVCIFFFFQAEDGIRDYKVTGVQTCALPISRSRGREHGLALDRVRGLSARRAPRRVGHLGGRGDGALPQPGGPAVRGGRHARSEERRVGKECRSRWSPYHLKKKKRYITTSAV